MFGWESNLCSIAESSATSIATQTAPIVASCVISHSRTQLCPIERSADFLELPARCYGRRHAGKKKGPAIGPAPCLREGD